MNCAENRETLSAELDGEARDEELIAVYRHLAECSDCRRWRRQTLALSNDFAHYEDHPLPPTIAARLRRGEEARSGRKRAKTVYRIPSRLAWAAAAVFVLQIGWSAYQLAGGPLPPPLPLPLVAEGETNDLIPEQIVLTSRDRTSSTVLSRKTEMTPKSNQPIQNGG